MIGGVDLSKTDVFDSSWHTSHFLSVQPYLLSFAKKRLNTDLEFNRLENFRP